MRKIIFILFLVCVSIKTFAQAQAYKTTLIGPFPAYKGQYAGWKWPVVYTLPKEIQDWLDGVGSKPIHLIGKCAFVVDEHGIGERSVNYPSMSTYGTGDAYRVLNYGQPVYWRDNNDPYYNKKYAAPGRTDSVYFIYSSFQVWQGDGYTRQTYTYNTFNWGLHNSPFAEFIDTNKVYLTGLSLGAGGVASGLQDENTLNMIAGSWSLMTGYKNVPNATPQYNWQALRNTKWRGIIVIEHAVDDDVVTYMMSRDMADSIAKYKLPITLIYRERTAGKHTAPVSDAWNPARANINIPMTNGNSYNHSTPWQSILLMRTKSGRRKD